VSVEVLGHALPIERPLRATLSQRPAEYAENQLLLKSGTSQGPENQDIQSFAGSTEHAPTSERAYEMRLRIEKNFDGLDINLRLIGAQRTNASLSVTTFLSC
jgi:hypothetical protein